MHWAEAKKEMGGRICGVVFEDSTLAMAGTKTERVLKLRGRVQLLDDHRINGRDCSKLQEETGDRILPHSNLRCAEYIQLCPCIVSFV